MKDYPLVLVEWEDAKVVDDETWVDVKLESKYEPLVMQTAGFLLVDAPEGIVITSTMSSTVMAPRDQIPRGMIRSITKLKPAAR